MTSSEGESAPQHGGESAADNDVDGDKASQSAASGKDADEPEAAPAKSETTFTIGFARASLEGLHAPVDIAEALQQSWVAGTEITRYNRQWTLSKTLSESENGRYGKIGFVNADQLDTLTFDEKELDFVRGQAPSGVVVPFVIAPDGLISYQLISGIVRDNTVIGALEALLNAGVKSPYSWSIEPVTIPITYNEWRKTVERVTRFDIRLERPNPHYHGDAIAEQLVENLRTEHTRLSGVERSDEPGIDTESDPFREALDHVLRNYGAATLTGVDSKGDRSVFVKMRDAVSRISAHVRVTGASGGPEVPEQSLREARSTLPAAASAENDDSASS